MGEALWCRWRGSRSNRYSFRKACDQKKDKWVWKHTLVFAWCFWKCQRLLQHCQAQLERQSWKAKQKDSTWSWRTWEVPTILANELTAKTTRHRPQKLTPQSIYCILHACTWSSDYFERHARFYPGISSLARDKDHFCSGICLRSILLHKSNCGHNRWHPG